LKNLHRIREMSFRSNEDGSLRTGMENDEKPSHYQQRIASFYKAKESAEPSSPGRSRDTSRSPRSRYRSRSPSAGGRGYQRRRSRSRSYSRSPRQPSYSRSPHYSRARSRSTRGRLNRSHTVVAGLAQDRQPSLRGHKHLQDPTFRFPSAW